MGRKRGKGAKGDSESFVTVYWRSKAINSSAAGTLLSFLS
jgi:hypothetical protein